MSKFDELYEATINEAPEDLHRANRGRFAAMYKRLLKPTTVGKQITINDGRKRFAAQNSGKMKFTVTQNISNEVKKVKLEGDSYLFVKGQGIFGGRKSWREEDLKALPKEYHQYLD
jgi:hypothetical protein